MKIKCDFEVDFFRISVDFGAILGPKIDPKWKKNGIKKQSDFKTMLTGGTTTKSSRTLRRQPPLAAPHMRALSSQNNRVRTKREERRRGKKEERTKREEEGRKQEGKYPGSDTPEARGLANYIVVECDCFLKIIMVVVPQNKTAILC